MAKSVRVITLSESSDGLYVVVQTPYNEEFVKGIKNIVGRRWLPQSKTWAVPASQKASLYSLMRTHFANRRAVGPKGEFVIQPHPYFQAPKLYKDMSDAEKARVDEQEAAKEARKAALERGCEATDGEPCGRSTCEGCEANVPFEPPPGSWASVARIMAAGDDSGFDWDAWKDEMKERDL